MHETTHETENVLERAAASVRVVLLVPIRPAPTGNGLAMRAWRHAQAFRHDDLVVLVLPIAGDACELWRKAPSSELFDAIVVPVAPPRQRTYQQGFVSLLGQPAWRERLARLEPMPTAARAAHPALVGYVRETIDATVSSWAPDAVIVFRSYLAPLGLALVESFSPEHPSRRADAVPSDLCPPDQPRPMPRALLDLDDDDVAVAIALGTGEEGAYARLVSVLSPEFDGVSVASQHDAGAIGERIGGSMPIQLVPNSIEVPDGPLDYGARTNTVTMIANFTYPPNERGARWLLEEVWPRFEAEWGRHGRRASRPVALRLVGPGRDRVDDIVSVYREAAVMAVPIREGGGTRIKVLEAWALGRPVVSTSVGVEGLDAEHGRDALIADSPDSFAEALLTLVENPDLAQRLIEGGRRSALRFRMEAVEPVLRRMVLGPPW